MSRRQLHRMFIQLYIHWMMMLLLRAAVPRDAMPMPMPVPLDDDVSLPLAAGSTAGAYPPLGVLAWVGGVAWCRARVGPLYIS